MLAAHLWLSAGLFLLVAWAWAWWLWVRPLAFRAVRCLRREGLVRWALVPAAVSAALWLAVQLAVRTDAGARVFLSCLPAAYVERLEAQAEARERTLESIREGLRRSAREAREGATE